MRPYPDITTTSRAWTFVELLVAISLSAVFLGAASLVYSSINVNSKRLATVVTVNVGAAQKQALYGQSGATLGAYAAPCFGRAAYARDFLGLIRDDLENASLAHCLPRIAMNTIRPEFLRYQAGDAGSSLAPPRLDTPENFRQFLISVEGGASAIYDTAIRNVPSASRPNTTLFILMPDANPGYLRVKAVYEIDYTAVTSPAGTYASARRYKNGALTHYYDVFFETGAGSLPVPSFVTFEQTSRKAVNEGTSIDRFKIAEWSPFYLLWLPDPAINPHKIANATATAPTSSPLRAYENLASRSSLSLVVPMFPSL